MIFDWSLSIIGTKCSSVISYPAYYWQRGKGALGVIRLTTSAPKLPQMSPHPPHPTHTSPFNASWLLPLHFLSPTKAIILCTTHIHAAHPFVLFDIMENAIIYIIQVLY